MGICFAVLVQSIRAVPKNIRLNCSKRVQQLRKASKKCYAKKIRENPEFYAAEKERIKEYI